MAETYVRHCLRQNLRALSCSLRVKVMVNREGSDRMDENGF